MADNIWPAACQCEHNYMYLSSLTLRLTSHINQSLVKKNVSHFLSVKLSTAYKRYLKYRIFWPKWMNFVISLKQTKTKTAKQERSIDVQTLSNSLNETTKVVMLPAFHI